MKARSSRTFLFQSLLLGAAVVPFAVAACGGDKAPPKEPTLPTATASETPSATPTASVTASTTPTPGPSTEPAPIEKKSKKADKKTDPSFLDCHKDYKPGGKNLDADVTKLAKACEKATKMKPVGKTIDGKQGAEGKPDAYPLEAKAGKCYRVYAESEKGITDLDLAIKDSNGDIAGEDSTDDPSPIVLEDGAVCFKEDDKAQVIVAVGGGKGKYALQVWSD